MRSRANSGEQMCIPGAISSMLPAGSGAPHTETRLRRENLRPHARETMNPIGGVSASSGNPRRPGTSRRRFRIDGTSPSSGTWASLRQSGRPGFQ